MKLVVNSIIAYISICILFFSYVISYSYINKRKIKFSFKKYLIILIGSFLIFLSNFFIQSNIRALIEFFILFLANYFLFNEKLNKVLIYTIIISIINLIIDFFMSVFLTFINIDYLLNFISISLIRSIYTFINSILLFLVFKIKKVVNISNRICKFIIYNFNTFISYLLFLFIMIYFITYALYYKTSNERIFIAVLILLFLLVIVFVILFQLNEIKKKQKDDFVLKMLIEEYESIIDHDRETRHDILNNLICLNSIKDKNSDEFNDLLKGLIETYDNKKGDNLNKITRLPQGIKGVVFYKLNKSQINDINLSVTISKEALKHFNKLKNKLSFNICKIIGILLDNSLDALSNIDNKVLVIDIYIENNKIIIYIENNFNGFVEIKDVNNKKFSTKGTGRGYGLYNVNKIINSFPELQLLQNIIENKFISTLVVKL